MQYNVKIIQLTHCDLKLRNGFTFDRAQATRFFVLVQVKLSLFVFIS